MWVTLTTYFLFPFVCEVIETSTLYCGFNQDRFVCQSSLSLFGWLLLFNICGF